MGVDGEAQRAAELQPDCYYVLGDVGSFFFDLTGDNDGFRVAVAAAEWAGTQTVWPDLGRDLDEGVAAVVLGSEWNANQSAQLDHCRAFGGNTTIVARVGLRFRVSWRRVWGRISSPAGRTALCVSRG